MSAMPELDESHLKRLIGRTETARAVISAYLVRQFNPTFDDVSAPRTIGETAPLLIHYCLAQPTAPTSSLGQDGHPARRLPAAGLVAAADVGRQRHRVPRRSAHRGRGGAHVAHRGRLDQGRAIGPERQTIVYRDADSGHAPAASAAAAPAGTTVERVVPLAWLLFRYSALTFNGHRIHYDLAYARKVEHYPGLIVHGPLQATLLARLATKMRGKTPTHFSFRSQSPIFDDLPFRLHASEAEDGVELWTAAEGGPLAMKACARWQ